VAATLLGISDNRKGENGAVKRRYRTGDQNWVRERNLAILLDYLWQAGGTISRARLTEISGLNKSTVGSLLADLQSWGLVKETGTAAQGPGRPGVLIDLNPDTGRVIGAEIGVDFAAAVVADLRGQVVWQRHVELPSEGAGTARKPASVLKRAERLVQEAVNQASTCRCRLYGIGLGVPGLVDRATGTLLFAPNLGWQDVQLGERWRERFSVPVVVENEANAAALGERMLGVARQVDNFVYLSAGIGLGGGVVIDGKLYSGVGGFAGEVGHMTLEPDGPPCNCGNRGCWETLVAPQAIVRRVREAARAQGTAGAAEVTSMDEVLDAAARGDPVVRSALDEVGRYLGIGIANLINAFNPSLVVLGGALSLAGQYVLPRAQKELDARALAAARGGVTIKLSDFKGDACVMGCVSLILRGIFENPRAWQPRQAAGAPQADGQNELVAGVL